MPGLSTRPSPRANAGAAAHAPVAGEGLATAAVSREDHEAHLHLLQVELVKLQRHFICCGDRVLVLLEGRDAAGKDGGIRRIVEYLSPRETSVVALGKPTERERGGWYFQRFVAHLPVAEEIVLFNRSWYNRAGVEPVRGLCSKDEHEEFLQSAPKFEELSVRLGDQAAEVLPGHRQERADAASRRTRARSAQAVEDQPRRRGGRQALEACSSARDAMLLRTHTAFARLDYPGKKNKLLQPDPAIVFEFSPDCIAAKQLAR